MAIKPKVNYPGKIDTTDANYPEGKAQNVTAPGDGTGTPWEAALLNDIFGFQQKLLAASGVAPSGSPDNIAASDYFDALEKMFSRALVYDETGAVDAYQIDAVAGAAANPGAYLEGLPVVFRATTANTGAATVQVAALGAIALELGGVALTGGEVVIGDYVKAIYRSAGPSFDIVTPVLQAEQVTYGNLSDSATEADNVAKRTAKVWVAFNGTGVVAIKDSFNVSSVTDGGVGLYTVNFTSALASANYAFAGSNRGANNGGSYAETTRVQVAGNILTGSIDLATTTVTASSGALVDFDHVSLIIFGG